jgi:hypothetical protein
VLIPTASAPSLRHFASIAPDDRRAAAWLSVFGRLRVEVEAPEPEPEEMPDGRVLILYRVQLSRLTPEELSRATLASARFWGVSPAEALEAIRTTDGLAIEAAGVSILTVEAMP